MICFFDIFYRHLTKISEIERVDIGPPHGSRGKLKTKKLFFFSQENYCKPMSDNYSIYIYIYIYSRDRTSG